MAAITQMETVTGTRRRRQAASPARTAVWLGMDDPRRPVAERLVRRIYREAYGARIQAPDAPLMALLDDRNRARAALALRNADAPFFLEQYLDGPVEWLLPPGQQRRGVVEVGGLAADFTGGSRCLVVALTGYLEAAGAEWVVFTARRSLRNTFARLGIDLLPLGEARPERLPGGAREWGSYYDDGPLVVAGHVPQGAAAVRARLERDRGPLTALWCQGQGLAAGALAPAACAGG